MFDLLLAQVVDAPVETDRVLISGHITWIVGLALTGFLGAASWAATKWAKAMEAKADGTTRGMLLGQLASFVEAVVYRLNGALVSKYKLAAADGKISGPEAKELADTALREIKQLLGEQGLLRIQKVFGWGPAEVDTEIRGLIEKKVVEAKVLAASTAAVRTPLPTIRPS